MERLSRREFLTYVSSLVGGVLLPDVSAEALERTLPVYYSLPKDKYGPDEVAITIDDCWVEKHLKKILEIAAKEQVPLTIFPAGAVFKNAAIKELLKKAAVDGCFLGNHTYSHYNLEALRKDQAEKEIRLGNETLRKNVAEAQILPLFRPPGGYFGATTKTALSKCPEVDSVVMWNSTSGGDRYSRGVGGEDNLKQTLSWQLGKLGSRKIVLLHAISNDAGIFPWLIEYLQKQGYRFADLQRLVERTAPAGN